MDHEKRIRAIIVDILVVDEDEVVPTASFREDLDADSLDLVDMIMALETEFDQEISDEDALQIVTVGDAYEYVQVRLQSSESS